MTEDILPDSRIITFNVSGMRYQTREAILDRFPDTLLGNSHKRQRFLNSKNEVFFDRDRRSFEAILHIYQTNGEVFRPKTVKLGRFLQELAFYGANDRMMAALWTSEGFEEPEEVVKPSNKYQRFVHEMIGHPDSSRAAKAFMMFSVAMIVISTVSFCVETMPEFSPNSSSIREWSSPFFWIEFACGIWFSLELIVRFLSSPSKVTFLKSFLNILDFVAVVPFFAFLTISTFSSFGAKYSQKFQLLKVLRLFQILRLTRHSSGLQILIETFKVSRNELMLMAIFLFIGLILFATGLHFAESNEPNTGFTSIPSSCWFVMFTTTTVGYGDLVPHSILGKVIGGACAFMGTLTMTFPISIIVNNFRECYRRALWMSALNRHRALADKHNNSNSIYFVPVTRNSKLRSSYSASSSSSED